MFLFRLLEISKSRQHILDEILKNTITTHKFRTQPEYSTDCVIWVCMKAILYTKDSEKCTFMLVLRTTRMVYRGARMTTCVDAGREFFVTDSLDCGSIVSMPISRQNLLNAVLVSPSLVEG